MLVVVVASWSKSRQKSKNLKRPEKSAKTIGSEEPSFLTSDTRLAFTKMYETHDGELLAIIEAFKIWRRYLKGCKHEVLVFTEAPILPSIPVRFAELKNTLDTTFGSIINQAVLANQRL